MARDQQVQESGRLSYWDIRMVTMVLYYLIIIAAINRLARATFS